MSNFDNFAMFSEEGNKRVQFIAQSAKELLYMFKDYQNVEEKCIDNLLTKYLENDTKKTLDNCCIDQSVGNIYFEQKETFDNSSNDKLFECGEEFFLNKQEIDQVWDYVLDSLENLRDEHVQFKEAYDSDVREKVYKYIFKNNLIKDILLREPALFYNLKQEMLNRDKS